MPDELSLDCATCGMHKVCRQSRLSWIFFFIGVLATVAMRVIEPLRSINPVYGKASWYVGVGGFLVFFIYKYRILRLRSKLIKDSELKVKLSKSGGLATADYHLLSELVCSQDNWGERANFFIIFALSGIALAVAAYFDFFT